MTSRPTSRRVVVALAAIAASAGLVAAPAQADFKVVKRELPRLVLEHKDAQGQDAYDYAPSTMAEDGGLTTWWCGTGDDGRFDRIYRARSPRLGGGWTGRQEVFRGQDSRKFDGVHTCDPDVIKDAGGYTMYYGGLGDTRGAPGTQDDFTAIGLASSPDGIHWTRENGGFPLIEARLMKRGVAYGAGQPSVVHARGWYTMIYTTVWHARRGPELKSGEFAVRSRDRLFRTGLQERRRRGWVAIGDRANGKPIAVKRDHPLFGREHVQNLAYLEPARKFVTIGAGGLLRFLDGESMDVVGKVRRIRSPMFREQRSFVRSSWGKIYASPRGRYDLSLVSAIKGRNDRRANDPFSWDLGVQPLQVAAR